MPLHPGGQNAGPPYTGTLAIACEKAGEGIEFTAKNGKGELIGTAKIIPQEGLGTVKLANLGGGTERAIEATAEVKGVKFEVLAPGKSPVLKTDGEFIGAATLAGVE